MSHCCIVVIQDNKGEMIIIANVSRYCDDIYECVADNGVPPAVSRQMRVTVECKLLFLYLYMKQRRI